MPGPGVRGSCQSPSCGPGPRDPPPHGDDADQHAVEHESRRHFEEYGPLLEFTAVGIDPGQLLSDRIDERVRDNEGQGLVEEVTRLGRRLGVRRRWRSDIASFVRRRQGCERGGVWGDIAVATMGLAKRQRTYFRRDPRIRWVSWSSDRTARMAISGTSVGSLMKFSKMEGLGNDFVVVDGSVTVDPDLVEALCDRHFGVGADGVLQVSLNGGQIVMGYWNADGGVAEMCGNGLRCVARYAYDQGLVGEKTFTVHDTSRKPPCRGRRPNPRRARPCDGGESRRWDDRTFYLATGRATPMRLHSARIRMAVDVAGIGRALEAGDTRGGQCGFCVWWTRPRSRCGSGSEALGKPWPAAAGWSPRPP